MPLWLCVLFLFFWFFLFVQTMSAHRESEREWRKVGDLRFMPQAAVVAILPEPEHERLREVLAGLDGYRRIRLVDAHWERSRIEQTLDGVRSVPFPE